MLCVQELLEICRDMQMSAHVSLEMPLHVGKYVTF